MGAGIVHKNSRLGKLPDERAQDNTRDLIRLLRACPFIVGRLVRARFVSAVPRIVTHRLGVPATFLVLRSKVASTIYPLFSEGADQTKLDINNQLRVTCTDDCDADLWFFERARGDVT
jgi:hypothetical protein